MNQITSSLQNSPKSSYRQRKLRKKSKSLNCGLRRPRRSALVALLTAFHPSPSLTCCSPAACTLVHKPAKLPSASVIPSAWTFVSPEPHLGGSFSLLPPSLICPRRSPVTLFSGLLVQCPAPQQNGPSTGNYRPRSLHTPSFQPRAHTMGAQHTHAAATRARGPPGSGRSRPPHHQ